MLIKKIVVSAFLLTIAIPLYTMQQKFSVTVSGRPLGLMQIQPGIFNHSCHPKATFHGPSLLHLIVEANNFIQQNKSIDKIDTIEESHFNTFLNQAKKELLQLVNNKSDKVVLPYSFTINSLYPYISIIAFPDTRNLYQGTIRVEHVLIQGKIALLNTVHQKKSEENIEVFVELKDFSEHKEISGISMDECYKKVAALLSQRATL